MSIDNALKLVRWVVPLGLVALAALVVADELDPDAAVFIATAALLAAAVALIPPDGWRNFGARLEKAEAFGFGVTLGEGNKAAKAALPEEQDLETEELTGSLADEWLQLRLLLEAKLAYIAKTMRPGEEKAGESHAHDFATIGSLHYDKYLTDAEARTAAALLSPSLVAPPDRRQFIKQAEKVVGSIRASVFHGMLRKRVKDLADSCDEIQRGEGRRPDFKARIGDREYRVASAFATQADSKILADVVKRVKAEKDESERRRRIVVIPDESESAPTAADADPRVVKLSELHQAITAQRE